MLNAKTIIDLFLHWEEKNPHEIFLRQAVNGSWQEYSWQEAGKRARQTLAALNKQGLTKGDRIVILSYNCADWIICDLAIMMGGYVSVPLYANVNASSMVKILEHSGSKLMFVGKLVDSDWLNLKDSIPDNVKTFCMKGYEKGGFQNWTEFVVDADSADPIDISEEDVFTIIYTSGTTGDPKGVVHVHRSIINALHIVEEIIELNKSGNRFLSYLPLSHAAERGLIEMGSLYCGASVSFIESLETFADNVVDVKPTIFFSVPRIWEKIQSKILEKMPQRKLDIILKIPFLNKMVKNKIAASLGLDKANVILTGAAPIPEELLSWYHKIGINIREAYGMSENFNVIAINPKEDNRIGTVGKIFEKQEVQIDPQSGEIFQKCDWLMKGYFRDEELTSKTIVDGFLHTGDIGSLSEDGYLTVKGRVKDIFKTAKGEYISPSVYEMKFLELDTIEQACVMGSSYAQPFIVVGLSSIGQKVSKEELTKQLLHALEFVNSKAMQYQKLKKAIVVKEEWTVANELLTPSLKMKRNALGQKYEATMKEIYQSDDIISWEN